MFIFLQKLEIICIKRGVALIKLIKDLDQLLMRLAKIDILCLVVARDTIMSLGNQQEY